MAPVCKFFQQGNCRNGANCRFEHPSANGNANPNPFGAPSNNNNRFGAFAPKDVTNPYKITKEAIKIDLTEERPYWILSSYGPGKDAPQQLFGGYPREQSFEELRLFVATNPNQQEALQHVQQLYQQAEAQVQTSLNNLDGAVQFIVAAENQHPNRHDICKQNSMGGATTNTFAVGNASSGFSTNPLNSTPATNQNAFSTPQANPFGAPSAPATTSAFGQPSALGKPGGFGTPAFGQPSLPGATGGSVFGAPSQPGATGSAFGQPSMMGAQPSAFAAPTGPSAFGQAGQQQQQQQTGAFGQPSALGAKPSPFGQAAPQIPAPTMGSAAPFGATTNAPPPSNPFGAPTNPFGQPSQPVQTGQPAAVNPFAAARMTSPAATQAMDVSSTPVAASNPFSQPAATGFGVPTGNSGFGLPQPQPQAQQFQQPQQLQQPQAQGQVQSSSGPYPPGSTKQHPPISAYASKDMSGRLSMFKGRPVMYNDEGKAGIRNPDGTWRKIWFPDGAPAYYSGTESDNPAKYDGNAKAAYAAMAQGARFAGDMPEVPPMREDCTWDF